MISCTLCNEDKEEYEYYKYNINKSGETGRCTTCILIKTNEHKRLNKDQQSHAKRLYNYGLSKIKYTAMLNEQYNLCKICFSDKALNVDHCHTTGVVRGLLCRNCNHMLGNADDDVDILFNAIKYLLKT